MPDFPYTRNREWINRSEGWTENDPVADADWFNSVEAAIHQGQDHEKLAPVNPALNPANFTDGQTLAWNAAEGYFDVVAPSEPGGTDSFNSQAVSLSNYNAEALQSSSYTRRTFDYARYDIGDNWDMDQNAYIVPEDGIYKISVSLSFQQMSAGSYVQVWLDKNDYDEDRICARREEGNGRCEAADQRGYQFVAGDAISCGFNSNSTTGTCAQSFMEIERIG